MKTTLSLAVLLLIGEASAIQHRHAGLHHHKKNVKGTSLVQTASDYEHEDDTEDIPEGVDPISLIQRGGKNLSRLEEQNKWAKYYSDTASRVQRDREIDEENWDSKYAQEEDAKSYEFLQTSYEHNGHEDDTDDIPDGLEPLSLHRKRGDPFFAKTSSELVADKEDMRLENQANEVQAIQD